MRRKRDPTLSDGALQFELEPGDVLPDGRPADAPPEWDRGPHGEPLGTTTVSASPSREINDLRKAFSRWDLLRIAQGILGRLPQPQRRRKTESQADFEARAAATEPRPWRTSWCQHRLSRDQDNREAMLVRVRRTESRAWFGNVQVCGSPWTCPVCSARISQQRRHYLRSLETGAAEQGLGIGLHTLTVPHGAGDDLEQLLDRLSEARRKMRSGRAWQRFRERWGWIGEARTLEVTHGANGWHPHFHAMHFCERTPAEGDERDQFHRQLHALWAEACRKVGLGFPTLEHGVDVRWGRADSVQGVVADYIAKWGFAGEVTGAQAKWKSKGGRTPWQLLAGASESRRDAWLWGLYARAFHGKRQLFVTPGLRDRLEAQPELDDFEAAQPEPHPDSDEIAYDVGIIEATDWYLVCRDRAHERVLAAAMEGCEAFDGVIADLRRRYRPPDLVPDHE